MKPLNPNGLRGFSEFRDPNDRAKANGSRADTKSKKRQNDGDSDDDIEVADDTEVKLEDKDPKEAGSLLSPEDLKRQGDLAEGVQKIRVSAFVYFGPVHHLLTRS